MTKQEIEIWAQAYISGQMVSEKTVDDEHWWAIEKFMDISSDSEDSFLEDCWKTINRILELQPQENVLGILAAGPLEDLIHYCGFSYIDKIEEEARKNPKFRWLLGGVWESSKPEIWKRIEIARVEAW